MCGVHVPQVPWCGGDLVVRDNTLMTGVFSATLGPYLPAAYDQIAPRFGSYGRVASSPRTGRSSGSRLPRRGTSVVRPDCSGA
jgi:hypothetical protein